MRKSRYQSYDKVLNLLLGENKHLLTYYNSVKYGIKDRNRCFLATYNLQRTFPPPASQEASIFRTKHHSSPWRFTLACVDSPDVNP